MSGNEALLAALQAQSQTRVYLQGLRSLWRSSRPDLLHVHDLDARLFAALAELEAEGWLKLPAAASFELVGNPRMPKFVTVVREACPPASTNWAALPWLPEFGFWPTLLEREKVIASQINAWMLTQAPTAVEVPLRERSLEILGDEKALDTRVRGGHLFNGRLPLSTIKAIQVPHPLPYRRVTAPGCPVLVVENHHTYWSFAEWNERALRYAAVVYGAGNIFCSSGQALALVLQETAALGAEYFGDLDPAGVMIPLRYMSSTGIPLVPAVPLYEAALASGLDAPGVIRLSNDDESLRRWLPGLAAVLIERWNAGRRIPQEAVGTTYLQRLSV